VIAAEIALRAQPLPDVIDLSIILTGSGFGGLLGATVGALRGSDLDAIARQSLVGTVLGGIVTAVMFIAVLLAGVA
jgi:hypothetical protein